MQVRLQYVKDDHPLPSPSEEKKAECEPVVFVLEHPSNSVMPFSKYWLRCHKCGLTANLGDHEVIVEGSIITISPSILCPRESCKAHYYIKNGEIQNC